MKPDLARIQSWAKSTFSDPKKLAKTVLENAIKNHQKIFDTVSKTSSDVKAKQFHTAGVDVADLTVDLLGPIPAAQPVSATTLQQQWIVAPQGGYLPVYNYGLYWS